MGILDTIRKISLDTDKPARMIIRGLNNQPIRDEDGSTTYIDLYSRDSAVAQKHQREIDRRRLVAARGGRGIKLTPEELAAESVELLVRLTAGGGTITRDGEVRPDEAFTGERLRPIFESVDDADFRAQVEDFINDRANFSSASSTS